ncbi:MAG TPA: hypothetical protein VFG19_07805 [Geobacteraceae bacterium]|nr:hypothetical protein [Geobacteraceae bacterium]
MHKIGISNFRLPDRRPNKENRGILLPQDSLSTLRFFASPEVVNMTLRAVARAELYDCWHPLWNAFAHCYVSIPDRLDSLSRIFPGITRVIHNSEILDGDILVSDFYTGLNYGYLSGDLEPVQVRVLKADGDTVRGEVLRPGDKVGGEIGFFMNEIWYFISHKLAVHNGGRSIRHWSAPGGSLGIG